MRIKRERWIADFETSVFDGQQDTEVWAAALVNLESPDEYESVLHSASIDEFMSQLFELKGKHDIYFHNLKFDGTFIMYWLIAKSGLSQLTTADGGLMSRKVASSLMTNGYIYTISDVGQWYSITIYHNGTELCIMDSLKILPFPVKAIGKAFNTKHQKTSIDYVGERHAGYEKTGEEKEYIANDVLVMKEALNIMFSEGHEKMTIGSNCMSEFKEMEFHDKGDYLRIYPDLTKIECPFKDFKNADEYIRKSYHGGWCYVKKGVEGVVQKGHGTVCDVNSLYPSVMHSDSGNGYPFGKPQWFKGNPPDIVFHRTTNGKRRFYYFIRIRTRFYLKAGKLPTIQIKGSPYYDGREWLTTSDFRGSEWVEDENGKRKKLRPELILTETDYDRLREHYELKDLEVVDGCYFMCDYGRFDRYINKWAEVKMKEKGAKRTIAKLFLNNLYGKMASSDDSSYAILSVDEGGKLIRAHREEHNKQSGYIAVGSAITSYARNFTITAAQLNYDSFLYADTDSLHCLCKPDEIKGAPEHPTKFLHWKYESEWDTAIFVRQKTYIEHQTHEDREECEPFYNIKCAGMGKGAKANLETLLVTNELEISDFKQGLTVEGNLKAKIIKGGTVLQEKTFRLR